MKNLGVDVIYVINRAEDSNRLKDLTKELETIEGLNLERIPAITGEVVDSIPKLIEDKTLFPVFTDPIGLLTKNIIATSLSHKKAIERFYRSKYETCLILEDDVKFTKAFYRDYSTGKFSKFIEDTKKIDYDIIFWGRNVDTYESEILYTNQKSEYLYETLLNTDQYGAHAYQLSKKGSEKLYNQLKTIKYAADIFLESCDAVRYSPKESYFFQYRGDMQPITVKTIKDFIEKINFEGENMEIREFLKTTGIDIDTNYSEWNNGLYRRNVMQSMVYKDIPVEKVTYPPRTLPNGNVVENWASIHFKKNK